MMKKIYCIKCNKYRKFKNRKKSYIFYKTDFCIICDRFDSKDKKIFEEPIEILKILGLTINTEQH